MQQCGVSRASHQENAATNPVLNLQVVESFSRRARLSPAVTSSQAPPRHSGLQEWRPDKLRMEDQAYSRCPRAVLSTSPGRAGDPLVSRERKTTLQDQNDKKLTIGVA